MKQATALTLAGFLTMAVLSAAAGAQLAPNGPLPNHATKIELVPTDAGVKLEAWGVAEKSVKNGVEEFAVRIVANARDGALFEVTIETAQDKYDVGAIQLRLSSGVLVLKSSVHPSEAFPVTRIRGVVVTYKGKAVVRGQFPERELGG